MTTISILTCLSRIRISQTEFDKAKYGIVGRKLVCLGHPFASPQVALSIGLKYNSGHDKEIDMYNYIEEVIDDVLTPLIQQGPRRDLPADPYL